MYTFLRSHSPEIATYIPDRYKEGYGLSLRGIDFAQDNGFELIIALDCGIKAIEQVRYAKERGIDIVICDHHRPGPELPEAAAILNPKRSDCAYPYKELCGCGVGYKLAQALTTHYGQMPSTTNPLLDLVATAVAADIVPVTGENRILATFGLLQLNKEGRPGIRALLKNRNKEEYQLSDLVFSVAPRINAAGRMLHGSRAVDLLSSEDPQVVESLAEEIEQLNQNRRETEKQNTDEALAFIEEKGLQDQCSTVVYQENWHKGVIGIVASRLMEHHYRPTVVFTQSQGKWVASARSIPGFDLYQGLTECAEHIEQFGGHTFAAGLTVLPEKLPAFIERFEAVVQEHLGTEKQEPELHIDKEVQLEELTPSFYQILRQFAPFGPENPSPLFSSRGLTDTGRSRKVGQDQTHLKAEFNQNGTLFGGIGFSLADRLSDMADQQAVDVVFSLEENQWQGRTSLQLEIKDLRPSGKDSKLSEEPS
ncbi:single-stranded-DNA-specific exonuclease RecJ [Aureicoccus marinus]|uniref:single-stranded-DNA-specific exonuclease RecJ n=1 Tax=Aureicoccus marinus TaxID=754435 RepID=UPI00267A10D8|nr:single-stranded-DNA-specific exonuclease RecJ [Aureicoccus marinus]